MKLQYLKSKYDSLSTKKNLTGKEALSAVKQEGDALRYVQMQTEEICLAAVEQDGYALQFVQENMFKQEPIELTLEEIASRFNIDVNLLKIIK